MSLIQRAMERSLQAAAAPPAGTPEAPAGDANAPTVAALAGDVEAHAATAATPAGDAETAFPFTPIPAGDAETAFLLPEMPAGDAEAAFPSPAAPAGDTEAAPAALPPVDDAAASTAPVPAAIAMAPPRARAAPATMPASSVESPAAAAPPQQTCDVCDVLVIGGGPAGSTIAALLAAEGRDVVLVEREHHPRIRPGESLLPVNAALFDRLGVREQVEAIGMPKFGVEFVAPEYEAPSRFDWGDAWDSTTPYGWQVRRSELDQLLFRNAAARGARTVEGCRVGEVDFDESGADVDAWLDDGTRRRWRARFVVDASGRDTLLARRYGLRKDDPRHDSTAIFGHFAGAERLRGREEGHAGVYWFEHGWCWFLPLADGSTSVGAVCRPRYLRMRDRPLDQFFADTIALAPRLAERLKNATLIGEVRTAGSAAHAATRCTGERHLLVGDAAASTDPAFWSGVYLAMHGASEGARLVATMLDQPGEAAAARQRFEADTARLRDEFAWFARRVTHPTLRDMLMAPRVASRDALLALLAGEPGGSAVTPGPAPARRLRRLYYAISLARLPRSIGAWWRHRGDARDGGPRVGEAFVEAR